MVRKPRFENLLDSSIESNVSAGVFRGCFAVKVERNVDFLIEIIAFMLSDATRLYVAAREGARSRALVFSEDSVSKTLAG